MEISTLMLDLNSIKDRQRAIEVKATALQWIVGLKSHMAICKGLTAQPRFYEVGIAGLEIGKCIAVALTDQEHSSDTLTADGNVIVTAPLSVEILAAFAASLIHVTNVANQMPDSVHPDNMESTAFLISTRDLFVEQAVTAINESKGN